MKRVFLGALVGIGLVYFLDPAQGSRRRGKVAKLAGGSTPPPEPYRPPTAQHPTPPPAPPAGAANSGPTASNPAPPAPPAPPKAEGGSKSEAATAERAPKHDSGKVHDNQDPDDNTLRDRVESELFANTEYGREHLNINVVKGIVEIRGELPSQKEIDEVVRQVGAIRNVKSVRNFLHLPGTPAPNKESALETS